MFLAHQERVQKGFAREDIVGTVELPESGRTEPGRGPFSPTAGRMLLIENECRERPLEDGGAHCARA
jgi:hypothetical protein